MFLRNYDNCWTLLNSQEVFYSSGTMSNSTTQWGNGYFNVKTTSGSLAGVRFFYTSDTYYEYFSPLLALSAQTICLGTGSEPVTYDDYKLSGNSISLSLSSKSSTTTFDNNSKKWKRTIVCTCPNLTENDVTITEWGIFRNNSSSSGSVVAYSNNSSGLALLFREVLDTPITIKAGTTSTLTFSIDIPMPNHP